MKTEIEPSLPILENDVFRTAFNFSSIGMSIVSLNGNWLDCNNSICRITGYSKEELLQITFQDITYADDLEKDLYLMGRLLQGEIDHYEMEKRYIHKVGHTVWILLTASLARNEMGEPLYIIGQVQDISKRKRFEAQLKQRERDLESVLNNTRTVITRFDREYRHLYVNNVIEFEINIPASKLIGKTFAELNLVNAATAKVEETIDLVFTTKKPHQIEIENEITTDEPYYFAHFTPEFNENGDVETVLVISMNVTKLKTAEIELRRIHDEVQQLREILPICSYCRQVRDDKDYWQTVENYITANTNKQFSHGICPDCYENKIKPQLIAKGIKPTSDGK